MAFIAFCQPKGNRKLSAKKVVTKRLAAVSWFYQPLLISHDRLFIEHQGAHYVRFYPAFSR
jgi:hypothetical protein